MAARLWTIEQRQRQAELIRQWQPWQHSTGARTIAGKGIASRNAFKGGMMQEIKLLNKQLNSLMREQMKLIKNV